MTKHIKQESEIKNLTSEISAAIEAAYRRGFTDGIAATIFLCKNRRDVTRDRLCHALDVATKMRDDRQPHLDFSRDLLRTMAK